jgi:formylglycine-generating enzyme required for sulfatase activity
MMEDWANQAEGNEDLPVQEFEFQVVTVNRLGEVTQRQTHQARQFTEKLDAMVSLEMVVIPGGVFTMGSRAGEGYEDERPQHLVRVAPFLMSKYPVTQETWNVVMDWTPPYRCRGARRPVDRVSWQDAGEFCRRLSERTGRGYRLPSEAEWEYACRAGTTTPFTFGETITTDLVNYVGEHTYGSGPKGVYRHETNDVGGLPANRFGLHDMHGNVWEWCADAWHDNYIGAPTNGGVWEDGTGSRRVLRGGCWHDPPDLCRSAVRLAHVPNEGEDYFGFRLALPSLHGYTK